MPETLNSNQQEEKMTMFTDRSYLHRIDRRLVLKGAAAAAGSAVLAGTYTGPAIGQDTGIVFWDYRNPPGSVGHQYFLDAAARFKAQTGIDVTVEFKSAEGIEQAVAAAANARQGFDSMIWWSGPTVRNQASLGNVIALDDHVSAETVAAKAGMSAMKYEGQIYAMPFTIGTYFLVYNRVLLDDAGVDPGVFPLANDVPVAWDVFLDACDKIKAKGNAAPLMYASKEGYFNEWYFYNFIAMGFDNTDELAAIGSGNASWQHEDIYRALEAYQQLYQAGYFVEGGEVVAYEQHVRQMGSGQCAMSVYFDVYGGASAAIREAFGEDAIGFSRVPAYRTDKGLYGSSSLEPNAVYVAAFGDRQEESIKWVNFLMSLEEVNEVARSLQTAPADGRFDPSLISDPKLAQVYQGAAQKGHVYPWTLVTSAQYDALLKNGITYLSGRMTAQELCAIFDEVDKEYLESL